ncbi:MAG: DUF488 domain-containing protein [Gemmatimonadota bacterium]|nr:DUF488 domain-containing protein [Gemmatimonadota bacterium]
MDGQRTETRTPRQVPPPAWTIGHSTLDLSRLFERLSAHRIDQLADVRRYPASRRHPQFNRETLSAYLESRGVTYRWYEGLGGRRSGLPRRESPNRGLEVSGFRQYADYMLTDEFRAAFAELVEWLEEGRTSILCAELLWWQCHRRLIADQLVARGGTVYHVRDESRVDPHRLWDLARVTPDGLYYPPVQTELEIE